MAEDREQAQRKRRFRFKIGWYTLPALILIAFTAWLLINMAQQSGSALVRVLLGIFVVLAAAALLFKALERPTHLD
jgi:FtsH-binding integral membrane protein